MIDLGEIDWKTRTAEQMTMRIPWATGGIGAFRGTSFRISGVPKFASFRWPWLRPDYLICCL
jgi:hypothetical protein